MTTRDRQPGTRGTDPAHLPSSATQDPATDARAVVTITEQTGAARVFRAHWASPEYLIPLVAHFLAWVDEGRHRLITQA